MRRSCETGYGSLKTEYRYGRSAGMIKWYECEGETATSSYPAASALRGTLRVSLPPPDGFGRQGYTRQGSRLHHGQRGRL
jgi:hypothetical protein